MKLLVANICVYASTMLVGFLLGASVVAKVDTFLIATLGASIFTLVLSFFVRKRIKKEDEVV